MQIVVDLLIGIIGSLLATWLMFVWNWRKEQMLCLLQMRACIWEISTHIDYHYDCPIVIQAFIRWHELILRAYQMDTWVVWLLRGKERRLVHTILENMEGACGLARNVNIGESNRNDEYKSRMEKIKREIGFDEQRNKLYAEYSISLLRLIMIGWKCCSLQKALSRIGKHERDRIIVLLRERKIPGPSSNMLIDVKGFRADEIEKWLETISRHLKSDNKKMVMMGTKVYGV